MSKHIRFCDWQRPPFTSILSCYPLCAATPHKNFITCIKRHCFNVFCTSLVWTGLYNLTVHSRNNSNWFRRLQGSFWDACSSWRVSVGVKVLDFNTDYSTSLCPSVWHRTCAGAKHGECSVKNVAICYSYVCCFYMQRRNNLICCNPFTHPLVLPNFLGELPE